MDESYENTNNSNMIISKAVGDYTGDEDSSNYFLYILFVVDLNLNFF